MKKVIIAMFIAFAAFSMTANAAESGTHHRSRHRKMQQLRDFSRKGGCHWSGNGLPGIEMPGYRANYRSA